MPQQSHIGSDSKFPVDMEAFTHARSIRAVNEDNVYEGSGAAENLLYAVTQQARSKVRNDVGTGRTTKVHSAICLIRTDDYSELKLAIHEALGKAGYQGIEVSQDMRAGAHLGDTVCGIRIQFAW